MQYSFSYFYYVIHAKVNKTVEEVFRSVDVDNNNVLNMNEMRTLAVRTMGVPMDGYRFNEFICLLYNLSNTCAEDHKAPVDPNPPDFTNNNAVPSPIPTPSLLPLSQPITIDVLKNSTTVSEMVTKIHNLRHKYKTSVLGTDDVAFIMVNQNDSKLENRLDGIRREQQRFVCLNDDIDHSDPNAPFVCLLLFPLLSSSFFPLTRRF